MPAISLVVCLYQERDLLERLLHESSGLYDDLVVVHDGTEKNETLSSRQNPPGVDYSLSAPHSTIPEGYRAGLDDADKGSIQELVLRHDGKYFEGPRSFQQEPHWPFAWSRTSHDWILRLDADEIPSGQLKKWLHDFRVSEEPEESTSGYTCIWPTWNGRRVMTERWPDGRIFLFHKQRVRFFGMVEQVPVADRAFTPLPLALLHQPKRKSYGILNVLFRKQAYGWRRAIAQSLLTDPTKLPRWRWTSQQWPGEWEQIRSAPLRTALIRLFTWPIYTTKTLLRHRHFPYPSLVVQSGIHHFLICVQFMRARRQALSARRDNKTAGVTE